MFAPADEHQLLLYKFWLHSMSVGACMLTYLVDTPLPYRPLQIASVAEVSLALTGYHASRKGMRACASDGSSKDASMRMS